MNIVAINEVKSSADARIVDDMHQLRSRVFHDRMGWRVQCFDGREVDEFDSLHPTYIIALSSDERVIGCARLLPAIGPTMLQQTFPQLLWNGKLDANHTTIESSRFCVDTASGEGRAGRSLNDVTLAMLAGIVEWCLINGFSQIVTATDVRFERILGRAGWPMRRLGDVTLVNETRSVAGILPVDSASFDRLRPTDYRSNFEIIHPAACVRRVA